ncbi:MAG: amidohydrolase family protein [Gammaproteobacteria bacterium]
MKKQMQRRFKLIRQGLLTTTFGLAACTTAAIQPQGSGDSLLLQAARVFDGQNLRTGQAVLVKDGKIAAIGPRQSFEGNGAPVLDLGDATLLPGLIELHAHLNYLHVPADIVLTHGITTLRDLGGPVHALQGGDGRLRVLTAGPLLTAAPEGYPIPRLGSQDIAIAIKDEAHARATVKQLIADGAALIKVALEPGGEAGAPWSIDHHHGHAPQHGHEAQAAAAGQWPVLSETVVKAIVEEAHALGRRVTAHVGDAHGVTVALNAGVDEWAHMPCAEVPDELLQKAAAQQVSIIGTLDTLSRCHGVEHNTRRWAALGGELLYGTEIAHPDIPWGVDAQELNLMMQWAGLTPLQALEAATAKAGARVGVPLLGTLQTGAPADLIAVKGDALANFKSLEYPELVISGGQVVLNQF